MKTASEKAASKPGPSTGDGVLVDPQWLEAHLLDPRAGGRSRRQPGRLQRLAH